jgi:hypothetical protein
MKGVSFLLNEENQKIAVQIELKTIAKYQKKNRRFIRRYNC